jgi:7,8-dihydropterin-6-yl-methyl-4-(beta-D-ribofuranosyl)aminobenzene 5'-phosphate synthase
VSLHDIERVSITLLMDNITDMLLTSSAQAERPPMVEEEKFLPPPIAEHGFSALIEIFYHDHQKKKQISNRFLFDTGVSEDGIIFNADLFRINLSNIEAIILSHGHLDHFGGLLSVMKRTSKPLKVVAHPDAFLKRWLLFPDGTKAKMPVLDEIELKAHGALIEKRRNASYLPLDNHACDDYRPRLLVTGQIPRMTSFEKGFPVQYLEIPERNELVPDPLVNDDQAIIVNIKEKGLVIITGCAHAGIINTIKYAKDITAVNKVYAIIGGFHLTGSLYEGSIEKTVETIQSEKPNYIVPCHCTGWKAVNRIIQTMPKQFLQSSVGTTFNF